METITNIKQSAYNVMSLLYRARKGLASDELITSENARHTALYRLYSCQAVGKIHLFCSSTGRIISFAKKNNILRKECSYSGLSHEFAEDQLFVR